MWMNLNKTNLRIALVLYKLPLHKVENYTATCESKRKKSMWNGQFEFTIPK